MNPLMKRWKDQVDKTRNIRPPTSGSMMGQEIREGIFCTSKHLVIINTVSDAGKGTLRAIPRKRKAAFSSFHDSAAIESAALAGGKAVGVKEIGNGLTRNGQESK